MEKSMNIPTIFVIFGVTGDLMAKKIGPALFHLFQKQSLPSLFRIVGVGRRDFSKSDFYAHLSHILTEDATIIPEQGGIDSFLELCTYQKSLFEDAQGYNDLARTIKAIDDEWGMCSNKLFYLAVPPEHYENIFQHLAHSGLTTACGPTEGWTRIIVEKPFGKDLETAERLDTLLGTLFEEKQIYRIDHYLAKEMLQNILSFRFSNNIFEKSWNNEFIESIDIRFNETIGIGERGAFYDAAGAFRDVGQNHILQMLALTTLDHPKTLDGDAIRARRTEILNTLCGMEDQTIIRETFRAQVLDFHTLKGVMPHSTTETYFKITAALDAPRWSGVRITLEGGKNLAHVRKEIVVTFKHPMPCLCPKDAGHYKNIVVFSLEPTEEVRIHVWAKKPGLAYEIEEKIFHLSLRDKKEKTQYQYVEEYEKLLLDCVAGDQTLFVSSDEVRAMWRFTDPIIRAWKRNAIPLASYEPGTNPS